MLNTVYPVFIVMLLWYVYVYEIVACQWKLNVKKDTESVSVILLPLIEWVVYFVCLSVILSIWISSQVS